MELRLKVLEGKSAGTEIPVAVKRFFIGRAEDCQLRPGSEMVSRHHCVLLTEEDFIAVRDFGSKNGTFVNDERVAGERELKAGDRLQVGPLKFEVILKTGIGTKKLPPVQDIREAVSRTAAADAQSSKVDVDSWLNEPAAEIQRETTRLSLGETEMIRTGVTKEMPAQDAPEEAPVEAAFDASATISADAEGAEPGKKAPGKFVPAPKKGSTNSQDAAQNFLNQLRKRR
jgi:pSer/pThr/pTyr-binding forkhead associated (FHA) protein